MSEQNPLETLALDPKEIDKLFKMDPEDLTDEQMNKIVAAQRAERGEHVQNKAKGKTTRKRSTKKKREATEEELQGGLAALGLDLSDIKL